MLAELVQLQAPIAELQLLQIVNGNEMITNENKISFHFMMLASCNIRRVRRLSEPTQADPELELITMRRSGESR